MDWFFGSRLLLVACQAASVFFYSVLNSSHAAASAKKQTHKVFLKKKCSPVIVFGNFYQSDFGEQNKALIYATWSSFICTQRFQQITICFNLFMEWTLSVCLCYKLCVSNGNNLRPGALSELQYFIPDANPSLQLTRSCIQFIPIQSSNIINGPQMLILIVTFNR